MGQNQQVAGLTLDSGKGIMISYVRLVKVHFPKDRVLSYRGNLHARGRGNLLG
jgi:hypothetical protein